MPICVLNGNPNALKKIELGRLIWDIRSVVALVLEVPEEFVTVDVPYLLRSTTNTAHLTIFANYTEERFISLDDRTMIIEDRVRELYPGGEIDVSLVLTPIGVADKGDVPRAQQFYEYLLSLRP